MNELNAKGKFKDVNLSLIPFFPNWVKNRQSDHYLKDNFAKDTLGSVSEVQPNLNLWSVIQGEPGQIVSTN